MINVAVENPFDIFCRICSCCVEDKKGLTSIFESEDLLEKITSCLPISIHEEDNLPHQVCEKCITMIENSYELVKKAQSSEKYFYNFFRDEGKNKKVKEKFSGMDFDDNSEYSSNLGLLELDGSVQCDLCEIKVSRADLDSHIQEHHFNQAAPPNTEFTLNKICSLCGQLFDGEEVYVLHKCESFHKCVDCGKRMPNKCLMNRHIQHSCKSLYYCPHCHKTFTSKAIFLKHVQDHTGEESKSGCLACDRKTKGSGEVTEHICVQTIEEHDNSGTKKFKCYICGQAYMRQLSLAKHCLTHEPKSDWKYKCLKCGESFEKERTLQIHYAKVHKIARAWVCRFCGKSLSTKLSLQIHERIHTQVKPYVCEWCGNAFRCKPNLIQHQAIHTGVRKHGCHVCGKMFSRPFFLQTHLRVHTGERPFECDICERRFTQLTDMRRHRKRHDKSTPKLPELESLSEPTDYQTMIVVTEDGAEIPDEFYHEVIVGSYNNFPEEIVEFKAEATYE